MVRFSWVRSGLLAGLFGTAACASLPEMSRTQVVRDIDIEMQLSPSDLYVAPGDEVRWVNLRKEWVLIQIPALVSDDLLCQKGFTDWRGRLMESVKLEPNETAALCFKEPAEIRYNVRAQTAVGGGNLVMPGTVYVEAPEAE